MQEAIRLQEWELSIAAKAGICNLINESIH